MPNTNPVIHLPGGGAVRRRDRVRVTTAEMKYLKQLHAIAQKYNLGLHCGECGGDFVGENTGHEQYLVIHCKCRELIGENK